MSADLVTPEPVQGTRGLKYRDAIVLATVLMMVAMGVSIAIRDGIGIIADVALVVVTLIVGILIQKQDWLASVWAPPLSWFIALITVGQFATRSTGSFKAKQAILLVYGLGAHAIWIVGCTVLAIVIHFIRQIGK